MATIVVLEQSAGLGLRQVRMRDRVLARMRTSTLDHQLAAGASPEASVTLALHAGHLCGPVQRRLLARSLTRIAAAAEAPTGRRVKAPVCRQAVLRTRAELSAVVDRLVADGPIDVQGVARLRNLLADGTGPLYRDSPPEHLRAELLAALAALDSFA